MIQINNRPISVKLLTLENSVDFNGKTLIYRPNDDEMKMFNQDLEENLSDPFGVKYGYISYKSRLLDNKMGLGYYFLSAFLLTIPNLLGMPFMNIKYEVESEIRIFDRDRKLLAKYSAIGKSKSIVAYYYGYGLRYAARKSYSEAVLSALNQIRPLIERESTLINEKLLEAGKL